MATAKDKRLGSYLKDRRQRLNPAALGIAPDRRRTFGLRREEVAERARVSATWYTWLEQGRGGMPSADALARIAAALQLTAAEREQLFMLAQRRPPDGVYAPSDRVTPRLQRVLDTLEASPAYVRTAAFDLVAWNRAATVVFTDYALLAPEQRNLLRLLFCDQRVRAKMPNWEEDARFTVATFRLEATRVGAGGRVAEVAEQLCDESPEFNAMWAAHDVTTHGEGSKHIVHPVAGALALEYSAFAVNAQPDFSLVIYTPASPDDRAKVEALLAAQPSQAMCSPATGP